MTALYTSDALDRLLPVSEIFGPVVQGEGELIGIPTLFVRFGGCDSRCSWCDSLHAVLPAFKDTWTKMTATAILDRCRALQPPPYFVTLSGGNPALHPLGPLVDAMTAVGYMTVVETQGTKWPAWLDCVTSLVISPKPPSSGERPDLHRLRTELRRLKDTGHPWYSVKVVVFNEADLIFADAVRHIVHEETGKPLVLQVGNPLPPDPDGTAGPSVAELRTVLLDRYVELCNQVLALGWANVRILPQLHALAHGNARAK